MVSSTCGCFEKMEMDQMTPVALCMRRGPWALAAMFALLRRGIAFVPVDITLPVKRRTYMLHKLHIWHVITDEDMRMQFPEETVLTETELACGHISAGSVECAKAGDMAYYLYTSGSTGDPKAVQISQYAFRNFIEDLPRSIPLQARERIACLTSMSFDIFFLESVLALKHGLQVVLASEEERKNPECVISLIRNEQVDVVQITPSHLQLLQCCDREFTFLEHVRCLLVGGEAFPENLFRALKEHICCRIYNLYGPTEATVWASAADLTEEEEIHIGTPFLHTQFYVLDAKHMPLEDGATGELCIGGSGLADGYAGDEQKTTEKFITPLFGNGLRLYCTGDLAVKRNGHYIVLGRMDHQVKYRGHRIELEEIDMHCCRLPGVLRAVTYLAEEEDGGSLLTLYEGRMEAKEVRECLFSTLPPYMVPRRCMQVEKLFLNTNGKIDRKENYERYAAQRYGRKKDDAETTKDTKRLSETEQYVLDYIQMTLQPELEVLTSDTPIEALAMDSLDFITMVAGLETEYGITFEDRMLLAESFQTVRELTDYIVYRKNTMQKSGSKSRKGSEIDEAGLS